MLWLGIRKVAHTAGLLLAASVVVFLLLHLIPGDPALALAGPDATQAQLEHIQAALGLNRPLPEQYGQWLAGVVQGDFGESFIRRLPVAELIGQRWLPTLELALLGGFGSVLVGLPLGVYAATREGRPADVVISSVSAVVIAVPAFWIGILGILLFGLMLHWLPVGGYAPIEAGPVRFLRFLVLPVGVIAIAQGAILSRFVRSAVLEVLRDDHVRTARAKGVSEWKVIRDHAVRNALVPIVTVFGLQFGRLLGGTVIIEAVFSWPGLGTLLVESLKVRDYTVVQGCLLLLTAIFLVVNLATDLLYGALDPRIRGNRRLVRA